MAQSWRGDRRRPPCQNTCVARHTARYRYPLPQCLFTTLAAGFKIQFRKEMVKQPLCDMMLKRDEVVMLKEAIRQDYFFEMFFDDLPVWG